MLRNTPDSYGSISRVLHGLMAVLVIAMLCVGFVMEQLPRESSLRPQLLFLHKSTGVTLLVLVIIRVLWMLLNPRPRLLSTRAAERTLARLVHAGLYLGLLAMPLSGYLMATSGTRSFTYFGLFAVPRLAPSDALGDAATLVHQTLPWFFVGLIVLHLLGALKHRFIDRDATLKRMWRG